MKRRHRQLQVAVAFASVLACGTATPTPQPPTHEVLPRACMSDADCRGDDRICYEDRCQFVDDVARQRAARAQTTSEAPSLPLQPTPDAGFADAAGAEPGVEGPAQPVPSGPELDMFMGGARHNGRSPWTAPSTAPAIVFDVTVGGRIYGAPLVHSSGLVAVASSDQSVSVFAPRGRQAELVFRHVGAGRYNHTGLSLPNGLLVFAGSDGNVTALRATGQIAWQRRVGSQPIDMPLVYADGALWLVSGAAIVGLTSDGAARSQWPWEGVRTAVTERPDGSLCAVGVDGVLKCIHADGREAMRVSIGSSADGAPASDDYGTLYVGDDAGKLTAVASDGTVRWTVQTGASIRTTPAIDLAGNIYFGSDDRVFYSVDPAGQVRFRLQTGGRIRASARIDATGHILFGSQDDFLYAIDAAGTVQYRVNLGANVDASVAIAPNGTLYAATDSGHLFGLR